MALNERIQPNQQPTAVTGFTGAAPQSVNGNIVVMNKVDNSTLSAKVYALATTNTLTVTVKWQASDDGATWVDCASSPQNAANVALATGTGSAVTATRIIPAPVGVYGKRYARVVAVSGVGVGGGLGVDEASMSYNYRLPPQFML